MVSGLPFFYVRGAPPGNVGYFLDGVRVPYLYHVAARPFGRAPGDGRSRRSLLGRISRRGSAASRAASWPARRPRRATDFHGEATCASSTWARSSRAGSRTAAGRRSSAGATRTRRRSSRCSRPERVLDYRDYQARITYDLTPQGPGQPLRFRLVRSARPDARTTSRDRVRRRVLPRRHALRSCARRRRERADRGDPRHGQDPRRRDDRRPGPDDRRPHRAKTADQRRRASSRRCRRHRGRVRREHRAHPTIVRRYRKHAKSRP